MDATTKYPVHLFHEINEVKKNWKTERLLQRFWLAYPTSCGVFLLNFVWMHVACDTIYPYYFNSGSSYKA